MKSLVAIAVLTLVLTTGFTCSKNTPEAAKSEAPAQGNMDGQAPSQEQMAQPPAEIQPMEGAQPMEAPTAAPTEGEAKQ